MDRSTFKALTRHSPVFLDGATGTWLHAHGLSKGACPEVWALGHPDLLAQMHREYFRSGTTIAVSFTFGATEPKLAHYGIGADAVEALNRSLAEIACKARDEVREELRLSHSERPAPLVSGDIGPTGRFLAPAGDLSMDALVEIYRSQVRGLLAGGVDLFSLETMMDLGQTLAALRAVRMECDLPVLATLTFDVTGKTLSGNTPLECAIALEAAGADAIGANCSTGPEAMGLLLQGLAGRTGIPVAIKPNAGMPRLVEGHTVFDMGPESFVEAMLPFIRSGVGSFFGGCCGTTPEHIAQLVAAAEGITPEIPESVVPVSSEMICSSRVSITVPAADEVPFLAAADPDDLQDAVMDAMEDSPAAIGIDFRGIDSPDIAAFTEAMGWVQTVCPVPLVFRSDNDALLLALTAGYPGRAGIITNLPGDFNGAMRLS